MSRFENTPSRTVLYRIAEAFVDAFIDSYENPPKAIILDIDETDDPTYGAQQMALFNAHYNTTCYKPMHIYEGKTGKLITTILRPGKRPSGKEILAVIKRIVKKIRDIWPDVGIILRSDSHYSAPEVHDWCIENNVKFVLGQTPNNVLWGKARNVMADAKELYSSRRKPIKIFGEFIYKADSWSEPQRVIVKAEYNEKGTNTRFSARGESAFG